MKSGRDSLIRFVNELPPAIQSQYRTPGPRKWQSLSFLLNYAQFHIHHANEEYRLGASHLVSMLKNDLVPRRWWPIIFKDAEELLADGESCAVWSTDNDV
jgi:nuclear pore complex protein Nup85